MIKAKLADKLVADWHIIYIIKAVSSLKTHDVDEHNFVQKLTTRQAYRHLTRYTGTQVHRYTGTQIHRNTGTQAPGTQVHRRTDTQAHRYTGTQIHRHTFI